MTTAEAIDGITDTGDFEVLGVRSLREIDPNCRFIEHLGVNAEGKTRKNPIDAFVEVPGSQPPTYVMAQFATNAADDLEKKWLFDHDVANARAKIKGKPQTKVESDDGDLLKAARIAAGIRQKDSSAVFNLWLCSNRVLDPDLRTRVSTEAKARGLTVHFLSQTVLRDFLDLKPEGQWLRKLHLRIPARLLSREQLQALGQETVEMYASEIEVTYKTTFVPTDNSDLLGRAISQRRKNLVFVIGPSGSGKSVLAYQRLQSCLSSGGCALKISESLVLQCDSLAEAVEKALLKAAPDLEAGCGRMAFAIGEQCEFIIVVDDINRAPDPRRLVEKLAAWTKPPPGTSASSQNSLAPLVTVLCPLWESSWKAVYGSLSKLQWVANFEVQRLTKGDSVVLLRAALGGAASSLPDYKLEEVATRLAFDPILLAIFAAGVVADGGISDEITPPNAVIAHYEDDCFEALTHHHRLAKSEFRTAVSRVAGIMLDDRSFYPPWETLTEKLANEPHLLNALRILVADRKICRLTDQPGSEQFEFRHDRILDFALARKVTADLKTSGAADYLQEPYYARFVGEALANGQLPGAIVETVCAAMPAAIFAALASAESGTTSETAYADRAKIWLGPGGGFDDALLASQEQSVGFLEQTSSQAVVQIIPTAASLAKFGRALLRNGDFRAALYSVSDHGGSYLPAMQYDRLEADIEYVMARHGSHLLQQLRTLLETGTMPEQISAALTLAGYIARQELQPSVLRAVEHNAKGDLLLPALWGIMRCAGSGYENILKGLIDRWAQFPDPGPLGHTITERQLMTQTVRFFCRKGLPDDMVVFLVAHGRSNLAAGEVLASALSELDHPAAVALAVEKGIASDEWNLVMPNARQLSELSRSTLRRLWEDSARDFEVRRKAFRVWLNSASDARELSGLTVPDPWRASLLWRRCVVRDISVVSDLAPLLVQDPHWLHVARHVWSPALTAPTDTLMTIVAREIAAGTSGDADDRHYHLAELLRDIPQVDAESLLLKHWAGLSSAPKFIQAALYIGTPQLLALANAALAAHSDKVGALTHVCAFFGFMMHGLSERLSPKHISTLVEQRAILPDSELRQIASYCSATAGLRALAPLLRQEIENRAKFAPPDSPAGENRRRSFPTESELFHEFDKAVTWQFPEWLDRFETRTESKEALWSALLNWAKADIGKRYVAFAQAFALCATRSELTWLLRIPLEQLNGDQHRARDDALYAVKMRSLA